MYPKLKNIILTILLLGIGIGIFSFIKLTEYGYYEFDTAFNSAVVIFGLLIVFFFLPRSLKMKSRFLNFSALGISIVFLLITLNLTFIHFSHVKFDKMMSEYYILSCEDMNKRFEQDLENKELKYFSFGMVGSGNLTKNLKKYNIQNYDFGCLVNSNLVCYSKLVNVYLKEKEQVDINQLYD